MTPPTNIDGSTVQDITIDNQTVQEVTLDGQVVFSSGPSQVLLDYETGDLSRWDTVDTLQITNQNFNGSFGGRVDDISDASTPPAETIPDGFSGGVKLSEFEYYWNETSKSTGGGIELLNSNGSRELVLTSDNPQWIIIDGNGTNQVSGGGSASSSYNSNEYREFTIQFDFSNNQYSVNFNYQADGVSFTDSNRNLIKGVDVETVRIVGFTSAQGVNPNASMDMWFDDLLIKP